MRESSLAFCRNRRRMRNYLRSIYSLLLLLLLFSQSVALLTKHLNHKSRRPNERVNYPSIQLSMLSDIYLTCVHAASSSSTLRVITQYFDISVRKKKYDKTEKKTIARILTINLSASAFQAE